MNKLQLLLHSPQSRAITEYAWENEVFLKAWQKQINFYPRTPVPTSLCKAAPVIPLLLAKHLEIMSTFFSAQSFLCRLHTHQLKLNSCDINYGYPS